MDYLLTFFKMEAQANKIRNIKLDDAAQCDLFDGMTGAFYSDIQSIIELYRQSPNPVIRSIPNSLVVMILRVYRQLPWIVCRDYLGTCLSLYDGITNQHDKMVTPIPGMDKGRLMSSYHRDCKTVWNMILPSTPYPQEEPPAAAADVPSIKRKVVEAPAPLPPPPAPPSSVGGIKQPLLKKKTPLGKAPRTAAAAEDAAAEKRAVYNARRNAKRAAARLAAAYVDLNKLDEEIATSTAAKKSKKEEEKGKDHATTDDEEEEGGEEEESSSSEAEEAEESSATLPPPPPPPKPPVTKPSAKQSIKKEPIADIPEFKKKKAAAKPEPMEVSSSSSNEDEEPADMDLAIQRLKNKSIKGMSIQSELYILDAEVTVKNYQIEVLDPYYENWIRPATAQFKDVLLPPRRAGPLSVKLVNSTWLPPHCQEPKCTEPWSGKAMPRTLSQFAFVTGFCKDHDKNHTAFKNSTMKNVLNTCLCCQGSQNVRNKNVDNLPLVVFTTAPGFQSAVPDYALCADCCKKPHVLAQIRDMKLQPSKPFTESNCARILVELGIYTDPKRSKEFGMAFARDWIQRLGNAATPAVDPLASPVILEQQEPETPVAVVKGVSPARPPPSPAKIVPPPPPPPALTTPSPVVTFKKDLNKEKETIVSMACGMVPSGDDAISFEPRFRTAVDTDWKEAKDTRQLDMWITLLGIHTSKIAGPKIRESEIDNFIITEVNVGRKSAEDPLPSRGGPLDGEVWVTYQETTGDDNQERMWVTREPERIDKLYTTLRSKWIELINALKGIRKTMLSK
jgi:hypothetical protein